MSKKSSPLLDPPASSSLFERKDGRSNSYRNRSPPGKAVQQFAKAAEVTGGGNVNVDQLILVRGPISIAAAVIVKIGSGSA